MAKTVEKPKFPTKPCPKCGVAIHSRFKKHEACGWVMGGAAASTPHQAPKKKLGRPKKVATARTKATPAATGISMADIVAVKELAGKLGADKLRQLAQVLAD